MGADRVNVDRSVPPGGVIDLSIKLTAPPSEGSYRGHFTMYTPTGIRFMTSSGSQDGIWVDIQVQGSGPAPSPTPAVPASPTPPPAPETWTVHIRHDLNGGDWDLDWIDPHTITAPIMHLLLENVPKRLVPFQNQRYCSSVTHLILHNYC